MSNIGGARRRLLMMATKEELEERAKGLLQNTREMHPAEKIPSPTGSNVDASEEEIIEMDGAASPKSQLGEDAYKWKRELYLQEEEDVERRAVAKYAREVGEMLFQVDWTPMQGQPAPVGKEFCRVDLLRWIPQNQMDIESPKVAGARDMFFLGSKLWEQKWSLHFVYPPKEISENAFVLVPAAEVQIFLKVVTNTFGIVFDLRKTGLIMTFDDEAHATPCFIGQSESASSFDKLVGSVPSPDKLEPPNEKMIVDRTARDDSKWLEMMKTAMTVQENKRHFTKEKKSKQRVATRKEWCCQLLRLQRYLSLSRPYDARKPNLAPEGLLDPTAIPQYAFDFPTVFISIDAEAYERDHSKVTEIGISSLDMLDLTAIPPGKLGTDWVSHIHSRHFMIKENLGLVNTDFISGGGKFERGKSEVVSLGEIGAIIQSCFESPYCHTLPEGADGFQKMMYKQQYQIRTAMYKQRKLVLVGHDTKQDINYFGKLGFPIDNNVFHEILDTSELYRALMHDSETLSLARLLANFDIAGWNLHNAGNDAFYTLQALLAIGVQSRTSSLGDRRVPQYLDDKVGKAKEAAEAAALKEEEEWTEAAKGNRDGGQLTYRLTATSLDGTAEQEEVPKKKSSRDKKRAELDEEVKEFGRPVAL